MLLKYDVEPTLEKRLHSFAIRKKGAPTLHLAADTEEAAARWSTVIREAVERNNQVRISTNDNIIFNFDFFSIFFENTASSNLILSFS